MSSIPEQKQYITHDWFKLLASLLQFPIDYVAYKRKFEQMGSPLIDVVELLIDA